MKKLLVIFYLTVWLALPGFGQEETTRIPVTILGTHHFANPGADAFNIHQDDIKAPKRQKEVLTLVEHLLAFQPTKVLIESPYGDSMYKEYTTSLVLRFKYS